MTTTSISPLEDWCIETVSLGIGCNNGATCILDPTRDNGIRCICPPNYTGLFI